MSNMSSDVYTYKWMLIPIIHSGYLPWIKNTVLERVFLECKVSMALESVLVEWTLIF